MRRATLLVSLALLVAHPRSAAGQHIEHLDSLRARIGLAPLGAPSRTGSPWAMRAARAAAGGAAVSGVLTVVLVPALFQDSPAPATQPDYLQSLFFGGGTGTLAAFYDEASGGLLTVTGSAAPWVRTSVTLLEGTGGDTTALGIGPSFGAYLLEALDSADVLLDFRQFDNDGPDGIPDSGDDDGRVDALGFLFTEVARSCNGPGVWPHFSGLAGYNGGQPWAAADTGVGGQPITASTYVIISGSECDGQPISRVGVVAHELGHRLGQPDIYHVVTSDLSGLTSEYRRWVLGCFDLMAGGAWGCGPADAFPPFGPTHFSPWTRERLGWIALDTVGTVRRDTFTLAPVQSGRRALEIFVDPAQTESFLIEYRPATGFDADLPASGLLVYRHDRAAPLKPDSAAPRHYRIELLEADADSGLLHSHVEGGNRGVAGDLFATGGTVATLSNATTPSVRRADGTPTALTIHSVRIVNGSAELVLSNTAAPGAVVQGTAVFPAGASHAATFPIGGGAAPWSASAGSGVPAGLAVRVSADTLFLEGAAEAAGPFTARVTLADALAVQADVVIPLEVTLPSLPDAALIGALTGTAGLTPAQRRLVDHEGNGNGRLDVGDVRAWLRRTR